MDMLKDKKTIHLMVFFGVLFLLIALAELSVLGLERNQDTVTMLGCLLILIALILKAPNEEAKNIMMASLVFVILFAYVF